MNCSALTNYILGPESLREIVADICDRGYSLNLDESTDVATMKFRPKIKKVFCATLGMVEVRLISSVILCQELKDFLASSGIRLWSLIGIGTDGANNMFGGNHSLFTLLRDNGLLQLKIFKCVCNSRHLCASEAVGELPSNLEFMLSETYNLFNVSWLRTALANAQAHKRWEYPVEKIAPSNTRWLSRCRAVVHILKQYSELSANIQLSKEKERCYTS